MSNVACNMAGAGPMSSATIMAQRAILELEDRTDGYSAQNETPLEPVRAAIGSLCGAPTDRVALTTGGTDSLLRLLSSMRFGPDDVVLVSPSEFGTTAAAVAQLRDRCGITVGMLPSDPTGLLDLDACEQRLRSAPTTLILATLVPAHRGVRQPVEALARLCAAADVHLVVDICQALGHVPVDQKGLAGATLVGTGRKWLAGPRGTGFLVLGDHCSGRAALGVHPRLIGWEPEPLAAFEPLDGPCSGAWFERGEYPVAAFHGLGTAAAEALTACATNQHPLCATNPHPLGESQPLEGEPTDSSRGVPPIGALPETSAWQQASFAHAARLRAFLEDREWILLDDPRGGPTSIIGAVPPDGRRPTDIVDELRKRGIACSSMARGDAPLDPGWRGHAAVVRLSPSGTLDEGQLSYVEEVIAGL